VSDTPDHERDVDHGEVQRRSHESVQEVGPGGRFARPLTIAGYALAAIAVIYGLIAILR
jgi:hypothetical protein